MNTLPYVVTGLISGIIFGLAATGLVLTFKTSGLFNIGYGAVLTAAAMVFYALRVTLHWDWKAAFFVSVFVAGPLMGLAMEYVARSLAERSTSYKIAGTVGIMVLVPALCLIFYPGSNNGLPVERFLPLSNRLRYHIRVLGVNVFGDQWLTAGIVVAAVIGLFLLVRSTRIGMEMRAVVDNSSLLDLQGTSPIRVRRVAWVVGCTFASLSGVLILPSVGLQPATLTFLATYAFAAAAIGAFTSIPLAFLGGLLVGVLQSLVGYWVNSRGWATLSGLPDALPFVILFVVLLVLPRRRLWGGAEGTARTALEWKAPHSVRIGTGGIVIGALVLLPTFAGTKLPLFTYGLCEAILVLSLGLLVRTSGQVSLCQATFAAIGAAAFSQFTVGLKLPWLVALVLAALVTVPVGALVALPAIRLNGIYLALATFGFGILVTRLIFPQTWMFFTFVGSRAIPSPLGITSDRGHYYIVLVALGVMAVLAMLVVQSRLGRILRGMGGTQLGVSTLGLSTSITKVVVFCISAFMAAIAGIMYGMVLTSVDGGTAVFQPFNSFFLVAVLTVAPFGVPWYAIFAGLTSVIPGYFSGSKPTAILSAVFGFFAILVSMQGGPPPTPEWIRNLAERLAVRRSTPAVLDGPRGIVRPIGERARVDGIRTGLEVRGLNVRFGGLVAVEDVDLQAPLGQITGLIGPNGAGKTTTFNACSGINREVRGSFSFEGRDVTRLSAPARARLGLGRTFQKMELCDSLSVIDNVFLGYECPKAGSHILGQIVASGADRRAMRSAAKEALELCGIPGLSDKQVGALSTGHRRLVELARCLAGPFSLLLLDEPSSGLDRQETEAFGDVLLRVVEEKGCGVLLVEHDMSLVMRVCSEIYVLDFGRLIASGTPEEISGSPTVRAAYLGADFAGAPDAVLDVAQGPALR